MRADLLCQREECAKQCRAGALNWRIRLSLLATWFLHAFTPPSESNDSGTEKRETQAAIIWANYRQHSDKRQRWLRVTLLVGLFWLMIWLVVLEAQMHSPLRGESVFWLAMINGMVWLTLPFLYLLFGVLDEMLLCSALVRRLTRGKVRWPKKLLEITQREKPGIEVGRLNQWLAIRFVAKRTEISSRFIYGPFVVLLFLLMSLSTRFDNWDTSQAVLFILLLCVLIALVSAVLIRSTAQRARAKILAKLTSTSATGHYAAAKTQADGLQVLIDEIQQLDEGAFRRWYKEPAIRALLWVLGIASMLITDYVSVGG